MSSSTAKTFTVGWICALSHELTASRAMLDEEFAEPQDLDSSDDNVYVAGRIQNHHVIMACLPKGKTGKASAAGVATNMLRSFPSIRFGLMVGIGGAVPDKTDIRLGDVVVGESTGPYGGVIQYDMGKSRPNGFEVRGHLNKSPPVLLNAMSRLRAIHEAEDSEMSRYIEAGLTKFPKMRQQYGHPGSEHDILYRSRCQHRKQSGCSKCRAPDPIDRPARKDWEGKDDPHPHVFYGLIGSGDRVVASAVQRKKLAESAGILCFEMEAAGLTDSFPCLVIRGMSDYADAFKRDQWQRYAAMTAAAYAKELLGQIRAMDVNEAKSVASAVATQESRTLSQVPMHKGQVFPCEFVGYLTGASEPGLQFYGLESFISTVPDRKTHSFIERPELGQRLELGLRTSARAEAKASRSVVVVVCGFGGVGKTQLVLHYIENHQSDYKGVFWLDARSKLSVERDMSILYRLLFRLPTSAQTPSTEEMLVRIHAWFSAQAGKQDKYLLIFDNADNVTDDQNSDDVCLAALIPAAPSVEVIITTRISSVAGLSRMQPIQVGSLEKDQALDLFWTTSGLDKEKLSLENWSTAEEIVEEVGHLALAVELAGATISVERAMKMNLSLYLSEYRANRRELLERKPEWTARYTENILSAWEATYNCLSRTYSLAAKLLSLLALLDPTEISLDFFSLLFQNHQDDNERSEEDEDELSIWQDILVEGDETVTLRNVDMALARLESFSFLRYDESSKSYSMHKLVHDWCLQRLEDTKQVELCLSVVQAVASKLPCLEGDPGASCKMIKHVKQSASTIISVRKFMSVDEVDETISWLFAYISFLYKHWRWNEGEKVEQFILFERRSRYGNKHPLTLGMINHLSMILYRLGKYDEAAVLTRELLNERMRQFGFEHSDTIESIQALAVMYCEWGKLEESAMILEDLLRRLRQSAHVEEYDSEIRKAMCTLAAVAFRRGQLFEAESICNDILKNCTSQDRNGLSLSFSTTALLSCIFLKQAKMDDAVHVLEVLVENTIRNLGTKHSFTFLSMNRLTEALFLQGELEKAEIMGDLALRTGREMLGENDQSVLASQETFQVIKETRLRSLLIQPGSKV